MKKNHKNSLPMALLALALASGSLALVGCAHNGMNLDDAPLEAPILADFSNGAAEAMFPSNGWTNGSVFNCEWNAKNLTYSDSAMHLSISEHEGGSVENHNQYYGGEGRTYQYFGFGDYSVKMKPAKKHGTASTFFTCTGPYDFDAQGNPNPWDEIDIEFLGKDTTKVQFNYYVNGVGGHEYLYNLGFDASEEFHDYGYRWSEDSITWFVDNKPVYKVKASSSNPLPTTPGRILVNHWVGTPEAEGWMGRYTPGGNETADYKSISTSATPIGNIPEHHEVEIPEGEAAPFEFSGDAEYNIAQSEDKKDLTVSYTDLPGGSYKNVLAPAADGVGKTSFVATVKNNGSADAAIRINMQGTQHDGKSDCCNTSAGATGDVVVSTDLEWGGSSFILEAGAETTVVVNYTSNGTHGRLLNVMLMIDSHVYGDTSNHTGSVTFTNMYFAGEEIVEDNPVIEERGVLINDSRFSFNANAGYNLSYAEDGSSLDCVYTDIVGNSYLNINTDVSSIALGKTTFSVKIKNNGAAESKLRFDMEASNVVGNAENAGGHLDCATDCSATNDAPAYTDTTWAGSTVTVAAGAETVLTIHYTSNSERGHIKGLKIFFDSSTYNDEATHSGNINLSEMSFSGEEEVETAASESPITFASNDVYTVNQDNGTFTVSYSELAGNTYRNIVAPAADAALNNNTFIAKFKNNGEQSVKIRVDIQGSTSVSTGENSSTDACNVSAIGADVWTDTTWGGSHFNVAAGAEEVITITYDGNGEHGAVRNVLVSIDSSIGDETLRSGNVTISEIAFSNVVGE